MRASHWLTTTGLAAVIVTAVAAYRPASGAQAVAADVLVYKTATCGCCKKWVDYLKANGFTVSAKDISYEELGTMRAELGVPEKLSSCHTAVVGGYTIEGHVPAGDIQRLLKEKPKVAGLSAPGMPAASPGMDAGKDPYEVVSFDAKGHSTLWAKH